MNSLSICLLLILLLTTGCQKNTPSQQSSSSEKQGVPVDNQTPEGRNPPALTSPRVVQNPPIVTSPPIVQNPPIVTSPRVLRKQLVDPGISINPEIPKQPELVKVVKNGLHIENLSGNFGEIIISKKSKRIYVLKNYYKETVENIKAKIENSNFYFPNGFPGNDMNSSDHYCSSNLESGKSCKIAVVFEPKLILEEIGTLQISYSINSIKHEFQFSLNGKGKELTHAQRLLATLKDNFIEVTKVPNKDNIFKKEKKLIESVLAQGHSNNFNYNDYYHDPNKKNIEIWEKHLKIPRVIGYTFRSDRRAPEVPFSECSKEWKEGYEITDPVSGYIVKYPAQIDKNHNGMNCGVKDTGGFWPYATRAQDLIKINNLLLQYKKETGKDFNLAEQPVDHSSSGNSVDPGTATLSWYLQNVLNLSAYVHETYDYKGFVSTTTSVSFANGWSGEWVYITYVEGGFLLPDTDDPSFHFSTGGTFTAFSENEVAVVGGIPWEDVMGYYKKHSKKIYFREGFKEMDPVAYEKIIEAISSYK